jgi:hypothetical protein
MGTAAMALGMVAAISTISAQSAELHQGAQILTASSTPYGVENLAQEEIVRVIDDPHTGDRWLLMRNGLYPGGPGRLIRVELPRIAGQLILLQNGERHLRVASAGETAEAVPVIRAGDRLLIEEHSAHVDAVLEARALKPAALGSAFDVRLVIGGRVVRAVALGPGRAAFQVENGATEARP